MTAVALPTVQPITLPPPVKPTPPIGCWQRTKDGITWFVSIVVRASGWLIDIISSVVFSALRLIWPSGADRLEALWGRVTTIYERITGAIREDNLHTRINTLQDTNHQLIKKNRDLSFLIEQYKVSEDSLNWEKGVLTTERDTARKERDDRVHGRARLTRERDQLKNDLEQLQQHNNQTILEKEAAIEAKNRQQAAHDQALQQVVVIQKQLDQTKRNDQLLEQFRRIDEAYAEKRAVHLHPSMTEKELQKLIPLFDEQKIAYIQMIEESLPDLPDSSQVPLQGILDILNQESDHLKRISQEMHYYSQIQESLDQLHKTIQV